MTALLPPNLLKLFAPRPLPPFLKPLSKDERIRGPDRLSGVVDLLARAREEAEEAELQQGRADLAATTKAEATANESTPVIPEKGEVGVAEVKVETTMGADGEEEEAVEKPKKEKPKKKEKKDKVSELGVVGQEARKMRKELRVTRQEQYKKDLEKNCT